MNSESIIFQNSFVWPGFPTPQKGSANIFAKLWHTKKKNRITSWFDSPRIKSQTNAPTRSIYNFHRFSENKTIYIYIYPYPFEVTWILHGLINDVIYIAPGANRCPKALFDLGCMDAIGISDQAHGLRIAWPRMGIRWFFLSQLGHGRPAWIS